MSVKTMVSWDVTSCLLEGDTNVSEASAAYIFFREDKGSTMFRNTGTHLAVWHLRTPQCFAVTADELSHCASFLSLNYLTHKIIRSW